MATRHPHDTRFHISSGFNATGIVADNPFTLHGEAKLRVSVTGAGAANVLKVQARLFDASAFTDVLTVTGNASEVVDISTWDQVRFNITTYDSSPGSLIVSGFYSSSIDEPVSITGAVTGSFSPSGLTIGGLVTHVVLTSAAWTPLPSSALANRNSLTVQNISGNGNVVLWNYSNSVPSTEGFRIEDGGFKSVAIRDTIIVYARMLSGSGEVVVDEVA